MSGLRLFLSAKKPAKSELCASPVTMSHQQQSYFDFGNRRFDVLAYIQAIAATAIATLFAHVLESLGLSAASVMMTFLAAVVFVASRIGRGPAIMVSVLSVLLFNFFFTTPQYTLIVDHSDTVYDFLIMFAVALVISTLTTRIRQQAQTEVLYRASREFSAVRGAQVVATTAEAFLRQLLGGEVRIFLAHEEGLDFSNGSDDDARFATEAHRLRSAIGPWTNHRTDGISIYIPLVHGERSFGVVSWRSAKRGELHDMEHLRLFESVTHLLALALERDFLTREGQKKQAQVEAERVRNALLSSVSHDMRTPLAAIAGSAGALLEELHPDDHDRRELLTTIFDEADRLKRVVENLLSMTRIEADRLDIKCELQPLDEVLSTARRRIFRSLDDHRLEITAHPDLPLVPIDGLLIEQVLINLIENAVRYAPPQTPIQVVATSEKNHVSISVIDQGPGVPAADRERVFEKFYRAKVGTSKRSGGTGIGLSICKAIVEGHGGKIWTHSTPEDGNTFSFTLPIATTAAFAATAGK